MAQRLSTVTPTAGTLLELIRRGEVSTRAEAASVTGLSRTAVTARLDALMRAGLVVEGDEAPSTGGRPPTQLEFNAQSGVVLAIALGRSRTQLAVCDLDGRVLARSEAEHADGGPPDALIPRARKELAKLLRSLGRPDGDVRGVGLSVPGAVDAATGRVSSLVLREWDGVELAPYFAGLGAGVVAVQNDANTLALSELHGHLLRHRDLVVLKASTGLGCGLFVDGRLVVGARGAAGEMGHTKVAAAEGRACRCGDVGCLETVASGWALVQQSAADGEPVAHVRELVTSALGGNAAARHRIRESGRRVGEVLAGIVNLLNPGGLVIGGDMSAAYDIFVAGIRETLYAGATAAASQELEILPSSFGSDGAGVVGCAHLALSAVLAPAAVDRLLREG